jgi:hypothetical protein
MPALGQLLRCLWPLEGFRGKIRAPYAPDAPMSLDLIGRTLRRTACKRLPNIRMGNSKLSGNT